MAEVLSTNDIKKLSEEKWDEEQKWQIISSGLFGAAIVNLGGAYTEPSAANFAVFLGGALLGVSAYGFSRSLSFGRQRAVLDAEILARQRQVEPSVVTPVPGESPTV